MCCLSAKHAALRRKSKDGLARNQDNVSEWGDTSNPQIAVSVSQDYKNPTKCVGIGQDGPHHHFLEKLTCSRHDIAEKLLSWH